MWRINGYQLRMSEGDFGLALPVTVHGADLTAVDSLRFTVSLNDRVILVKDYDNIVDNTVSLEFSEEESALFAPGIYAYSLDWFQNGAFQCNLIERGRFIVGDKV